MDDWSPGDLALCVRGGGPALINGWRENGADYVLREGAVYVVRQTCIGNDGYALGLKFEGLMWGWCADRFCRIAPHEPDAEDAETIFQLVYAPSPVFVSPDARMEASVTSRPVTPNRPGGNLFGNDAPFPDHRASRGYPEAENMTGGC